MRASLFLILSVSICTCARFSFFLLLVCASCFSISAISLRRVFICCSSCSFFCLFDCVPDCATANGSGANNPKITRMKRIPFPPLSCRKEKHSPALSLIDFITPLESDTVHFLHRSTDLKWEIQYFIHLDLRKDQMHIEVFTSLFDVDAPLIGEGFALLLSCLLYTSDAADE